MYAFILIGSMTDSETTPQWRGMLTGDGIALQFLIPFLPCHVSKLQQPHSGAAGVPMNSKVVDSTNPGKALLQYLHSSVNCCRPFR